MTSRRKPQLTCFVMMPFAGEFEDIYRVVIKPAVEMSGYVSLRADELAGTGPILRQIIKLIAKADVLIVDVSRANPNVFYELGIAHSLAKPVIIISSDIEDVPFDLRQYRVLLYDATNLANVERFRRELRAAIESAQESSTSGSPVAEALPSADTVPRNELLKVQEELDKVKTTLVAKEAQLESLKTLSTGSAELLGIREDINRHLHRITNEIISHSERSIVEAKVELEKVRQENAVLQSAQREVRRLKQMTLVNPHWKGRDFELNNVLCFLLMPFSELWSNSVWKLIEAIVTRAGFLCRRADEQNGRVVMDDLWESLCSAKVIIADLTAKNPNVTYEVGMADVLGKEMILLSQTADDVPFDFLGLRLITYENSIEGAQDLEEKLTRRLRVLK